MKNFNELNLESTEELSYSEFLSDNHIEDQIERNEDIEIDFLLDLSSADLY
jgi:hypothetical protein